jgi:hypothetical protein
MEDDVINNQAKFVSEEIDHLKKCIDRKEETKRTIYSVSELSRAVRVVNHTSQFTHVT